ncbi:hypothetical protein [Brytella acorum]|uniref:Uncharacterized protein n=1 Tax=Brytella acorum TaxID=2959299 RepID=A0AA35UVA2_9PROT|nr:hypothetical protein [Brytella acorum]MDF3625478.1 hypothetical protein [Brytella acorum]CAI9120330.1 hypothetical protein LMG32879_001162 [Brytella acorum]
MRLLPRTEAVSRSRGGDRLSQRIEAQAGRIHALIAEQDDLTPAEIRARLAGNRHHFAIATLWSFFDRPQITWKNAPLTRRSDIPTRRQDWFDAHRTRLKTPAAPYGTKAPP